MIYLFHDGTIVYDESILTEEEKQSAWAVENLPKAEEVAGKYSLMKFDVVKKEIWYEYYDLPITPEQRIQQLETELGNVLLESAVDKAKITELEKAQGNLLMEIATLKMGGSL